MELSTAEYYKQLKCKDVAELLGISKATVWNYVKRNVIPEPRYPSPRQPRWKQGEVIEAYELHLDQSDITASGKEGEQGLQPHVKAKAKAKTAAPENIAQKLKDRFKIGKK